MSKLLYIEASPRKSRSKSIEVSQVFLSELKNAHPSIEFDKLDLCTSIFVEPTLAAPAETEATITKAKEAAVSMARSWQ